jgi:ribosomal protein S12 methylthiotransferase
LVGFPGETETDFQELLDFVTEMRFERVGVFQYSHEENTHAHKLNDDVPEEIKLQRAQDIMEIQQGISFDLNQEKVGNTYKVLFDKVENNYFVGRTEYDSPEVDNEVLVEATDNYLRIGDFANIKIDSADNFDLFGTVVK